MVAVGNLKLHRESPASLCYFKISLVFFSSFQGLPVSLSLLLPSSAMKASSGGPHHNTTIFGVSLHNHVALWPQPGEDPPDVLMKMGMVWIWRASHQLVSWTSIVLVTWRGEAYLRGLFCIMCCSRLLTHSLALDFFLLLLLSSLGLSPVLLLPVCCAVNSLSLMFLQPWCSSWQRVSDMAPNNYGQNLLKL